MPLPGRPTPPTQPIYATLRRRVRVDTTLLLIHHHSEGLLATDWGGLNEPNCDYN
jgi:hypothetical protein